MFSVVLIILCRRLRYAAICAELMNLTVQHMNNLWQIQSTLPQKGRPRIG